MGVALHVRNSGMLEFRGLELQLIMETRSAVQAKVTPSILSHPKPSLHCAVLF